MEQTLDNIRNFCIIAHVDFAYEVSRSMGVCHGSRSDGRSPRQARPRNRAVVEEFVYWGVEKV